MAHRVIEEIPMFAVVQTSGKQYRVEPGTRITVDRMAANDVGTTVKLEQVLLVGGNELKIGNPTVKGASVTAKVVSHDLGDRVITFKMRRRLRMRRRVGFRASLTELEIVSIDA
jgi:large subunit ribosomal protein L21